MRWLERLLYVSSLLLVAGIMMARANFTWILVHWTEDTTISKALGEVIRSGVLECGVFYSTVLASVFLPARAFLRSAVDPLARFEVKGDLDAAKKWLAANDLDRTWQDDARQILALLAPLLSAPVFDAIAKSGG